MHGLHNFKTQRKILWSLPNVEVMKLAAKRFKDVYGSEGGREIIDRISISVRAIACQGEKCTSRILPNSNKLFQLLHLAFALMMFISHSSSA